MIERHLEPFLRLDAGYYPVVTLTGPRQSGKTTLARKVFPDLFPCEIKSGATVQNSMFDTLRWWDQLAKTPAESSVLLYGGDGFSERKGIRVRPWFAV